MEKTTLDVFLSKEEESEGTSHRKTCPKCYGTGREILEVDPSSTLPVKHFRTCEKCEGRGWI